VKKILIVIIKAYKKVVSPLMPRVCRYYPSCSSYALEAISEHGAIKGSAMALWRIIRCNPFGAGGYDPVKPKH